MRHRLPAPYDTPPTEHCFSFITFWVRVPVLSENIKSTWPKSLFRLDVRTDGGRVALFIIHIQVIFDEPGLQNEHCLYSHIERYGQKIGKRTMNVKNCEWYLSHADSTAFGSDPTVPASRSSICCAPSLSSILLIGAQDKYERKSRLVQVRPVACSSGTESTHQHLREKHKQDAAIHRLL